MGQCGNGSFHHKQMFNGASGNVLLCHEQSSVDCKAASPTQRVTIPLSVRLRESRPTRL